MNSRSNDFSSPNRSFFPFRCIRTLTSLVITRSFPRFSSKRSRFPLPPLLPSHPSIPGRYHRVFAWFLCQFAPVGIGEEKTGWERGMMMKIQLECYQCNHCEQNNNNDNNNNHTLIYSPLLFRFDRSVLPLGQSNDGQCNVQAENKRRSGTVDYCTCSWIDPLSGDSRTVAGRGKSWESEEYGWRNVRIPYPIPIYRILQAIPRDKTALGQDACHEVWLPYPTVILPLIYRDDTTRHFIINTQYAARIAIRFKCESGRWGDGNLIFDL